LTRYLKKKEGGKKERRKELGRSLPPGLGNYKSFGVEPCFDQQRSFPSRDPALHGFHWISLREKTSGSLNLTEKRSNEALGSI